LVTAEGVGAAAEEDDGWVVVDFWGLDCCWVLFGMLG
jgi:hypothetical protein